MALPIPRRLPMLGLPAGCLAVLPFLRDDVSHGAALVPVCLTAAALCDLLTAGLLAARFLARGSAPLLGLAVAYLVAGLLGAAHALVLPGERLPAAMPSGEPPNLGAIAGPLVLISDLGALVIIARRGRRSPLE